MDNFDEIKQIWQSANTNGLPKTEEIIHTIKRYRIRQILKTSAVILVTLFMMFTMVWVVIAYKSQLLTTRIGEGCFFTAMFILLSFTLRSLKRITGSKNYSNAAFLKFLKQEQIRLIRYQQKTQIIGFGIASAGLFFYTYETVHSQPFVMLAVYSGILVWCLIAWFVIRPRAMGRKTKKLEETIEKLERFSNQLNEAN